jgi:hypothetical protein
LDAASKSRIRSFGHIQLCGALHVCWQTKEGVNGQYMVALLYRGWLCLATAGRIDQVYTIQACIALTNIKVEEVDNGRGMNINQYLALDLSDADDKLQDSSATQRGIPGRLYLYATTSFTS